jgi:hypothetical protein
MNLWKLSALAGAAAAFGIAYTQAEPCPTCTYSSTNELPEIATNRGTSDLIFACVPDTPCFGESIGDVGGESKLRIFCEISHFRYDDPIINYGQPGATHLHAFFGNTMTTATSDYTSLRTTGEGTCQGGVLNRSGYWMPAMIDGARNKVVIPRFIEFYYRTNSPDRYLDQPTPGQFEAITCPPPPAIACPTYGPRDIPKGLKLVSGVNPSTGTNGDGTTIYWSCINQNTGGSNGETLKAVFHDPGTPSNGIQSCVSTNDGVAATSYTIQLTLTTQDCWNGELDSDDHHTHVKPRLSDGVSRQVCPTTHPYIIPNLIMIVAYDVDDTYDYKNWYLSSDRHNGATWRAGETMHADFIWAWDPDLMRHISSQIWAFDGVEDHRTCQSGCLGDGTRLVANSVSTAWVAAASRFTDIPARGGARGKIRARVR